MSDLTVLCVTRADPYALPFLDEMTGLAADLDAHLVVAADGDRAHRTLDGIDADLILVRSHGYIESVLDDAVSYCPDGHILRLDDDERPSYEMYDWLLERCYETNDHWAFPRYNLWPDERSYITSLSLWPDLQTRLSVKAKAGGRTKIHYPSPYGTGVVANVAIEHHKFLIRDIDERRETLDRYERLQPGAGSRFRQFSVPEDLPTSQIAVAERDHHEAAA